jgi:hypothetical protein
VTAALCRFLLYIEMGLSIFGVGSCISTFAPGRFTPVEDVTVQVQDQVGTGDFLYSFLLSLM